MYHLSELNSGVFTILFFCLATLAVSAGLYASTRNKVLQLENDNVKPYTWGYYFGFFGAIVYGAISVFHLFIWICVISGKIGIHPQAFSIFLPYTIIIFMGMVSHIFVIKRKKIGFIVATILSFNLLIYLINFFYIKNRWEEL